MALEIIGRLDRKMPVQSGVSQRGEWMKREFILTTEDTYPKNICMNVWGKDKVEELEKYPLSLPKTPLYSDMTASVYKEDAVQLLSQQICNPVQWETLIRNMIASGMDTFWEIGPGRTLTNLIRKIDPAVTVRPALEYLEEGLC